MDLPRLVAACDRDLIRDLITEIAPGQTGQIDWNLQGRELGQAVQRVVRNAPHAWGKLQQIDTLARHGTTATLRSVLYHDRGLCNEFDELSCSLETAAVWLALKDDELFEYGLSALHVDRGLNKRSWKAFRANFGNAASFSFEPACLAEFERLVRHAIRVCNAFDTPGELEAHHFRRTLFPETTHSRRMLEQVTVFAEARLVTEDVFENSQLETKVRRKVDSISVIFDRARRELDVVTIGGRGFIEDVAKAFLQAFANEAPPLEPLVRRNINLKNFLQKPDLTLTDQTRFVRAKVDEVRILSPCGVLHTFDAKSLRNSEKDVYDCAKIDFADRSPFECTGWTVVSARVVFFAVPSKPGREPRPRAVELKSNGYTNLREQDDTDLYIADELLTRWGILEPNDRDGDDD